ncbi:DoxX family protein [Stomatohabitans albus]|uniref:DoxX family protein n=1 Tax=Stomatohabitans albus TaxID=3110766 RepID=UPI00300D7B57
MRLIRLLAHGALASIFISAGLNAFKNPKPLAVVAQDTIDGMGKRVEQFTGSSALSDADPSTVVRANGAAQVLGGISLFTGIFRKPAALGLIASLIPVTVAGHPFWKMSGGDRGAQQVHFLKNLGLMGGLLLVATEPRRKPFISIGSGTQQSISDAVGGVVDASLPRVMRHLNP